MLGEDLAETFRGLEQSSRMFDVAMDTALLHVQARVAVDPHGAALETWEAVVSAMQTGSALFAAASVTEGTVECRIHHEVRTIPASGPQNCADAGNWLTAFWLAIICRDQTRMTQLCEVPLDLLRSTETRYDEYVYHWVDALQTYWLERPGLAEKLTAAIEASYPEAATIAPRDLLQKVLYQPINLFYHFLRGSDEEFNQALVEALEFHKSYWTADEERAEDFGGYLALGPLAVTCLAYDAGRSIEVESEYLPKCLISRAWLGEFPT